MPSLISLIPAIWAGGFIVHAAESSPKDYVVPMTWTYYITFCLIVSCIILLINFIYDWRKKRLNGNSIKSR